MNRNQVTDMLILGEGSYLKSPSAAESSVTEDGTVCEWGEYTEYRQSSQ